MVEQGDYLVPRYQGQPFYDKPALPYWLMAGAFRLFGFTAGAGRAVSILAAAGCLALTIVLGRMLFGASAIASGLVLGTTLAFLSFSRLAMSDMLLCLFVLAAVTAWVGWLRRPNRRGFLALALGACLGCGFLTKGPIALVLSSAGLVVFGWLDRRALREIRPTDVLLAGAAFAGCGLGWFAALWLREGSDPLRHFFLQENLERFAGARYDVQRGLLYYFAAYLAEGLPWSPFLLLAAFSLRSESPSVERRDAWALFAWMALMLVPLTLSRGKIDYYLLPLYPAASLVVARFLRGARPKAVAVQVLLCGLALAFLIGGLAQSRVPVAWLPAGIGRFALPATALVAAAALLWAAWRSRPALTLGVPAAAAALVFVAFAHVLIPAFRAAQPQARALADIERELRYRPDARVVYCEDPARLQRDVLFHVRATMIERCDLLVAAASKQPQLFVLDPGEREFLRNLETMRDIAEYPVVPAAIATLDGLLSGVTPSRLVLAANYDTEDPVAQRKWRKERRRAIRAAERAMEEKRQ